MIRFSKLKSPKKSTKGGVILKKALGKMPTVTVMPGNVREENTPRLLTPRRAYLESARQKMQAIREMRRLVLIRHA